jgi:hypothetical protein
MLPCIMSARDGSHSMGAGGTMKEPPGTICHHVPSSAVAGRRCYCCSSQVCALGWPTLRLASVHRDSRRRTGNVFYICI